ncbi:MAG TPA: hypothetical protein VKD08_11025 [Ignavibacteriaceae bacterium]|jgi:hypothetical protein|nr:hypothetical protein [Ignavibacteriaceae bacterium]
MDKQQIIFEDLQRQLIEWNERFSELESRLLETHASLKTVWSETPEILHPEMKLVEMRMAELRESGTEASDELKFGLQKAIKVMKEAYLKASLHSHLEINKSFA